MPGASARALPLPFAPTLPWERPDWRGDRPGGGAGTSAFDLKALAPRRASPRSACPAGPASSSPVPSQGRAGVGVTPPRASPPEAGTGPGRACQAAALTSLSYEEHGDRFLPISVIAGNPSFLSQRED